MAKLGDICKIQSGGTPSRSEMAYWNDGTIPWVKISDIQNKYLDKTEEHITQLGHEKSSAKIFPAGTILYSIFATLGETCILNIDAATNQAIAGIQVNSDCVFRDYLYYYLLSQKAKVSFIGRGVAQNNINMKILKEFEVPLPPISEQRCIASILDKVTDLIAKRRAQLEKLDLLVKSRFVEMFGDFNINSKNWPVFSFNEIAIIDSRMTTDYDKYGDYPHIGIDSIEKDTGVLKGYRTIAEDKVISGKYIFTPEHIIYSKIRPNLNKVALPDFDGLCSADAYPILPISEKCNRIFLAYNMRSQFFLNYILQFCNRTNLPKVNRKEVMGFKTPLPPIKLQDSFADFVAITNKTKFTIQQSLERLETLKKSLMQKYFEQ